MTAHDPVKVITFVTAISYAVGLSAIHEPFFQGARPTSTLLAVAALIKPDWLVEIESIAFKAD